MTTGGQTSRGHDDGHRDLDPDTQGTIQDILRMYRGSEPSQSAEPLGPVEMSETDEGGNRDFSSAGDGGDRENDQTYASNCGTDFDHQQNSCRTGNETTGRFSRRLTESRSRKLRGLTDSISEAKQMQQIAPGELAFDDTNARNRVDDDDDEEGRDAQEPPESSYASTMSHSQSRAMNRSKASGGALQVTRRRDEDDNAAASRKQREIEEGRSVLFRCSVFLHRIYEYYRKQSFPLAEMSTRSRMQLYYQFGLNRILSASECLETLSAVLATHAPYRSLTEFASFYANAGDDEEALQQLCPVPYVAFLAFLEAVAMGGIGRMADTGEAGQAMNFPGAATGGCCDSTAGVMSLHHRENPFEPRLAQFKSGRGQMERLMVMMSESAGGKAVLRGAFGYRAATVYRAWMDSDFISAQHLPPAMAIMGQALVDQLRRVFVCYAASNGSNKVGEVTLVKFRAFARDCRLRPRRRWRYSHRHDVEWAPIERATGTIRAMRTKAPCFQRRK